MTTIASQRTIFQDGEALTSSDLDAISQNCTRRAWEHPGYADLIGYDLFNAIVSTDYERILEASSGTSYARSLGVFTVGGGLQPAIVSGRISTLRGGFIGVWNQDGTITAPEATGAPKMLWAHHDGLDVSFNHDAAGGGTTRWDVVYCTCDEVDTAPVARDFEDSVTGAKTSSSLVTSKVPTFSFAVLQGTPSSGTPALPAPSAGQHVLYAALVTPTSITEIRDFTIPVGQVKRCCLPASRGGHAPSQWISNINAFGGLASLNSGVDTYVYLYPPDGVAGNGNVRILGLRLTYKLPNTAEVKLGMVHMEGASPTFVDMVTDLTLALTRDGDVHSTTLDCRSFPQGDNGFGPCWGGGLKVKGSDYSSSTFAIRVKTIADPGGNAIIACEWYTLGG